MTKFIRQPIWAWHFLFRKLINHYFNLFNRHRPIQIAHFFFVWVWQIVSFRKLVPFMKVIKLVGIEFTEVLYYPLTSMESAAMPPLSFLMLVNYVLSLFCSVSLVRGLSTLLIFSMIQLSVLWIFFISCFQLH